MKDHGTYGMNQGTYVRSEILSPSRFTEELGNLEAENKVTNLAGVVRLPYSDSFIYLTEP